MDCLTAGIEKLRADGTGEAAIAALRHHYERVRSGDAGVLSERELEPVADLPGSTAPPTTTAARRGPSTMPWSSSSTAVWARRWA
jgi:hypothetical protein